MIPHVQENRDDVDEREYIYESDKYKKGKYLYFSYDIFVRFHPIYHFYLTICKFLGLIILL